MVRMKDWSLLVLLRRSRWYRLVSDVHLVEEQVSRGVDDESFNVCLERDVLVPSLVVGFIK
jgi:hypothetical protein